MRRALTGRLVVGACLLACVSTACSPTDPAPPPPSTTSTPTPTENPQEREQRLAYEAAEKSYREFRAEFYRVLRAGGSKSATPKMKATAGGPYLREATEVVQAYKGLRSRSTGELRIAYVRGNGYSPLAVALAVCEDSRSLKTFDKDGKVTGRGEVRLLDVNAEFRAGSWKIWSGTGHKVESCVS